jgi:transposase
MPHSRTRDGGLDVHKDSIAVAYVANDHDAEAISLGPLGPRPCAMDPLVRTRQAKAQPRLFVSDAGPGGSWRYRSLPQTGYDCWGVAPSCLPQQAGDHVPTARRAAVPWARLRRSGALTPVSVPTVEGEAMRDRSRAREDTLHELPPAQWRLRALRLRHDRR